MNHCSKYLWANAQMPIILSAVVKLSASGTLLSVNVPTVDWSLFRELIRKFGWQAETREELLDRFASSRTANPAISEEEIMDEVIAVRYAK